MNEGHTRNGYIPIITVILIILNGIVFIIQTFNGGSENTEALIKMGAAYTPLILENGEWYRLFAPMFLHIGVQHIIYNMLALFAAGQYVEQYFGKIRFIILYILSGIAGNLLSLFSELYITHSFAVSAGASGAISGVFGAMVILALDPRTRRYFSLPRVLFGLFFLVIPSKGAENINVAAHLGGLICGFLVALKMKRFLLCFSWLRCYSK